jgi:hypothetical protein
MGLPLAQTRERWFSITSSVFAFANTIEFGIVQKRRFMEQIEMTYYRLAYQKHQTTTWVWKSTALTSLSAVFHLLKTYSPLLPDGIRVFTASSKAALDEMLSHENSGQISASVTAGQFLRDRKLSVPERAKAMPELHSTENAARQVTELASLSSTRENDLVLASSGGGGVGVLEKRRLEIEWGPGSDHNADYLFSLPQFLAWMRLRARVQQGTLQP